MSDDPDYLFALQLQQQFDAAETSQPMKTKKSTVDSDFELALKLQNEIDDVTALNSSNELDAVYNMDMSNSKKTNEKKTNKMLSKPEHDQDGGGGGGYLDQTANLVHPEWELVDPTPDVFAMFTRFDEKFFQRRLGAVVVEWSKRMYSCAGICYQRGNRYVKEIIIRLSEPLLKLRPRKDLVETLLHEMIHAYCFVLNIREGNGGHGPNFKRIMTTINKVAGTNITVYHSFHDEVNAYKTHIWRCNGICQFHHPFQGWVKRTSNRAPGPNDQWWAKHQSECGGVFEKVQGPKPTPVPSKSSSNKVPKTQAKTETAVGNDIRNYLKKPTSGSGSGSSQPILSSTPAILATAGVATSAFPPTSYPGLSSNPMVASATAPSAAAVGGKRSNVRGFKDLNSSGEESPQVVTPRTEMQGKGYSLGSGESTTGTATTDAAKRNMLRDHWSKRFPAAGASTQVEPHPSKRARIHDPSWEAVDNEVWVRDEIKSTITISDSEDDDREQQPASIFKEPAGVSDRNVKANANANISVLIKREIMEDETSFDDDEIMMIDDEFDDNDNSFTAATELADQSVIDDLFGEDTLLQEFQRENDVVPTCSSYHHDERNDITTCPICFDKMKRSEFTNHLDGCSIVIKVKPPSFKGKSQLPVSVGPSNNNRNKRRVSNKSRGKPRASSNKHEILKSSGYTSDEIAALNLSSSGDSSSELTPRQRRQFNAPATVVNLNSSGESGAELTPRQIRQRSLNSTNTQCPKCGRELANYLMEAHGKFCKG